VQTHMLPVLADAAVLAAGCMHFMEI
jgi:hypothetical protein